MALEDIGIAEVDGVHLGSSFGQRLDLKRHLEGPVYLRIVTQAAKPKPFDDATLDQAASVTPFKGKIQPFDELHPVERATKSRTALQRAVRRFEDSFIRTPQSASRLVFGDNCLWRGHNN